MGPLWPQHADRTVGALSEFGIRGPTDVDHVIDVQSADWRPDGGLPVVAALRERATHQKPKPAVVHESEYILDVDKKRIVQERRRK